VRVRFCGKEALRYAGPDRETALAVANRIMRERDRRDLLGEVATPEIDFEAFAEQYLEHVKRTMTKKSIVARVQLVRGLLIPFFGHLRIAQITPAEVHRFLATTAGVSGATRNRSVTALSALFRRALDMALLTENPCSRVRRAKEPRTPLTLVDAKHQDAILAQLCEPIRTFFLLLTDTGLRLSEAIDLDRRDLDFDAGTVHVRASKAKRPRIVVMTTRLRAALKSLEAGRTLPMQGPDAVFPKARATGDLLVWTWRIAFKRAAAAIGVPSLRIHDLRHIFAVNLVRRGIDLPTVQQVLGHTSLLSTLRYAEYADDSAAFRAAKALDALHGIPSAAVAASAAVPETKLSAGSVRAKKPAFGHKGTRRPASDAKKREAMPPGAVAEMRPERPAPFPPLRLLKS
jgi:integrase